MSENRDDFLESLKYTKLEKKNIEVPTFVAKRKEIIDELYKKEQRAMRSNKKRNSQTYKAKKGTASKAKHKASNRSKQLRKRIGILLASGVIATSGIIAYQTHRNQTEPISIEQSEELGNTPEELGIDEEIIQKIENINERLSDQSISNIELIKMSSEINNLQFDVIKTKIANALGVSESEIRLNARNRDEGPSIRIGEELYRNKDFIDNIISKNSGGISNDIASYIDKIVEMQNFMGKLQNKDYNRKETFNMYERQMEEISKFAAAKMIVDGNKISVDYTRTSEYNERIEEQKENGEER